MLSVPPNKRLIGHRGAARYKPENTFLSFQTAIANGLNWIELDAQPTKCNRWVCMHDNTLDRTTNGHGPVVKYTLEEIQKLEAGRWFNPPMYGIHPPSIQEVVNFARFNKISANIEIKDTSLHTSKYVQSFIDYLKLSDNPQSYSNIFISSFELEFLIELRHKIPSIPIAYLVEKITDQSFEIVRQNRFQMLNSDIMTFTQNDLTEAKRLSIPISLYTCNDKEEAKYWLEHGVFSLFTDVPTLLDT